MNVKCDCGSASEIEHDENCTLWSDNSFRRGTGIWDAEQGAVLHFMDWLANQNIESLDQVLKLWPWKIDKNQLIQVVSEEEGIQQTQLFNACSFCGDTPAWCIQCEKEECICGAQKYACEECFGGERDTVVTHDTPVCDVCDCLDAVFCTECGIEWDKCSCTDVTDYYCQRCQHDFTWEPEIDWEEDDTEVVPHCSCTPERVYYCKRCGVERDSSLDPWRWEGTPAGDPHCACVPEKDYYCGQCNVRRAAKTLPWERAAAYGSEYGWVSCRHKEAIVTFPSGVKVLASSRHDRDPNAPAPDFGLYLDGTWNPACLAYLLDWPDFGLPVRRELAMKAIIECFERAKNGERVEVGCIGGHGRTGAVLACMAVLGGVKGKNSVKWVRKNYCTEAIESKRQEWFPLWFEAQLNGTEAPPEPVIVSTWKSLGKTTTTTTTTTKPTVHSKREHYRSWLRGETCATKSGAPCSFWKADTDQFCEGTLPDVHEQVEAEVLEDIQKQLFVNNLSLNPLSITCLGKDCDATLTEDTMECPECHLHYSTVYWNGNREKREMYLRLTDKYMNDDERPLLEQNGEFVWLGEQGWLPLNLLPDDVQEYVEATEEVQRLAEVGEIIASTLKENA